MRFVKVIWMDAQHGPGTWQTKKELPKASPIVSYGWIAYEDDEYVVLAGSHYNDGDEDVWGMTIAIPCDMVRQMDDINA